MLYLLFNQELPAINVVPVHAPVRQPIYHRSHVGREAHAGPRQAGLERIPDTRNHTWQGTLTSPSTVQRR